ncbi:hypothetical protein ACJZ2D_013760 [Fusarium nematophilum]
MKRPRSESLDSDSPGSPASDSAAVEDVSTPSPEVTETVTFVAVDGSSVLDGEDAMDTRSESPAPEMINPRAYQREMLEQSLKRNVILAMDTGSGKTQVAVLRIQAELEKCSPEKIVWFLAQTVSLCEQQFKVIQRQNPSISMKLLTGQLNIDAWSPEVWPKILGGTRIVVSTIEILRQALEHGFVNMGMLALIVFDEAHNCVGNSAGRKIMLNFYHRDKADGNPVPAILGLTASPVISSNLASIERLESTMDAMCTTPTVHREELLRCVNRPHLVRSVYDSEKWPENTTLMRALHQVYQSMDIRNDPYVVKLRGKRTEESRKKLKNAILRDDTFSQNQMKGLWNRSKDIRRELGPWAADQYISIMAGSFVDRLNSADPFADTWANEERTYLAGYLDQIPITPLGNKVPPPTADELSHKVTRLIHELIAAGSNVVGIIFVKERATANVLCKLLNSLPAVCEQYHAGTMVGTSKSGSRKQNMYEFNNSVSLQTLEDFRSGAINLLVATSVLEEGIDVPACNLVVCFDETTTLKSFIQRRGRARMQESKMIAMESSTASSRTWEELEAGMKRRYQDDQRELERLDELARSEATGSTYYIVKSSGARLDLDNARQHLEHFCQVVFKRDYVDRRPDYIFHEVPDLGEPHLRATVMLPSGLPAHLRKFESASAWRAEKNAMKDAAFQAYVALYEEGLVSDNLLPICEISGNTEEVSELQAEPLFNPWIQVAEEWHGVGDKWVYPLEFFDENHEHKGRYDVVLPAELQKPRNIKIHPESGVEWSVEFGPGKRISHEAAAQLPDHTSTLIALHFGHRRPVEDRSHVLKFIHRGEDISRKQIGEVPFQEAGDRAINGEFLIRDLKACPYSYLDIIPSKPPVEQVQHPFYEYETGPEGESYLVLDKWPRRADFLHPVPESGQNPRTSSKPYGRVLPISWATADTLPRRLVQFGMLIPSIIHDIEVQLIASELSSSLLQPVGIMDLQLVVEAISSRSAAEPVDYERLEFLGDSILKYCTVVQAFAEHPHWPEGLLVHFKDRLVSNARLHRACLESGLSKFILSASFTGRKWKPLYTENFLEDGVTQGPGRSLGPKNLADVVEALIGASFQDGGMTKALKCISFFLGDSNCRWHEDGFGRRILFNEAAKGVTLPPTLDGLEELIGYSFCKKALLTEAVTHASYMGETHPRSYEQLEFLGDAVLDYIIVAKMFNFQPPIPNGRLHMIKTALVNGEFLAFANLKHELRRKETEIKEDGVVEDKEVSLSLWKFMRFTSPEIGREQVKATERFEKLRADILDSLERGTHYPWALLARLQPNKFYSDLFESLVGAVWVDSGSIDACESVLARFRILPYLDRVLRDNVHIQHPKEELTKLAGNKKIQYECTVHEGVDKEYSCRVKVGDRVVGDVRGGVNKEEIMTKAAEQGVKLLSMDKKVPEEGVEPMDAV